MLVLSDILSPEPPCTDVSSRLTTPLSDGLQYMINIVVQHKGNPSAQHSSHVLDKELCTRYICSRLLQATYL